MSCVVDVNEEKWNNLRTRLSLLSNTNKTHRVISFFLSLFFRDREIDYALLWSGCSVMARMRSHVRPLASIK